VGAELERTGHLALQAVKLLALVAASASLAGATQVTKIRVGLAPCAEIGGYGSVWVANYSSATLSRVDPATNRVTGTVRVGAQPCGLAAGAGSIWVDGYGTGTIERVNPKTLRRVKAIPTGPGVWDVGFDGRYVWADDNGDGTVVKIDPRRNRLVHRYHTGGSPTGLAIADGSVWIGSNGVLDRTFFRISLATGRITRVTPRGCKLPAYFAVRGTDDVWVTCVGDRISPGTVLRLDQKTNRVRARVGVGINPGDGAIDGAGRVWIPNKNSGTVSRIDPATNTVAETVTVGGAPFVINEAFGDVWVPDNIGTTVARLHVG
jgi:YVTN family beta-propeller protein